MIVRARNMDGYENIFRKPLENIFISPSAPASTPKLL